MLRGQGVVDDSYHFVKARAYRKKRCRFNDAFFTIYFEHCTIIFNRTLRKSMSSRIISKRVVLIENSNREKDK